MTMTSDHVRPLIARHFRGAIAPADEAVMRAHLVDCDDCRDTYRRALAFDALDPRRLPREERLARALGLPAGATMHALRRTRSSSSPMWWASLATSAAAVAIVLVVVVVAHRGDEGAAEPQERGAQESAAAGEAAELVVYRVRAAEGGAPDPEGPQLAQGAIRRGDELAFAVRNPRGRARALIFGVDEHGHVRWFHPAWPTPQPVPRAVDAPHGGRDLVELAGAVAHDYDGARLDIVLWLIDDDVRVDDVERRLAGATAGHVRDRLPAGPDVAVASFSVDGG